MIDHRCIDFKGKKKPPSTTPKHSFEDITAATHHLTHFTQQRFNAVTQFGMPQTLASLFLSLSFFPPALFNVYLSVALF